MNHPARNGSLCFDLEGKTVVTARAVLVRRQLPDLATLSVIRDATMAKEPKIPLLNSQPARVKSAMLTEEEPRRCGNVGRGNLLQMRELVPACHR
ncbi:hypothetical protein [Petrachloros mirabilis]